MSQNKKFDDAMQTVAAFVASHDFIPETVEGTVQIVLDHLKKQNREITVSNMNIALAEVKTMIRSRMQEKAAEPEGDAEIEKYRKQIAEWSSAQMKEFCKDPAVLAAVESVLNAPRPKPKKEVPKTEPKPAPKPPVKKDPLEVSIESMSADAFKKALQDPAKARGIENTLQAAARRNQ